MEPIWQWGLDLIRTVQLVHGPMLDALFKAITSLGEELFFLTLLPVIFWCVDLGGGVRLALAYLLSAYINTGLKNLFGHPRPFELDPMVQLHSFGVRGYGLPSGHSQFAVVVWGTIAAEFRKRWLWIVCIVLMVLVGFSRIYLGVHFPTDVLAGWAVGGVYLALYLALEPRVETWLRGIDVTTQLALAVAVPLGLLLVYPAPDNTSAMGALLGMGAGLVLCRRIVPFSAGGLLWQRVVRFLVGAVGLFGLYFGLRLVFPAEGEPLYIASRVLRYALVGLWGTLGAPWLFLRLRLASREGD